MRRAPPLSFLTASRRRQLCSPSARSQPSLRREARRFPFVFGASRRRRQQAARRSAARIGAAARSRKQSPRREARRRFVSCAVRAASSAARAAWQPCGAVLAHSGVPSRPFVALHVQQVVQPAMLVDVQRDVRALEARSRPLVH